MAFHLPYVMFSPKRSGPRKIYTTNTTKMNHTAHKYVQDQAIQLLILSKILLKTPAMLDVVNGVTEKIACQLLILFYK